MRDFIYKKVATLEEALLAYTPGTMILAGGTNLTIKLKKDLCCPDAVLDIKEIPGLNRIEYDSPNGFIIGAAATLRSVEQSTLVKEKIPLVAFSAKLMRSVQIRNRATIGGTLCSGLGATEISTSLLALDARLRMARKEGERELALEDFFLRIPRTSLYPNEILTQVRIPSAGPKKYAYIKHSLRKGMDLPQAGVAVALSLDRSENNCREVRIAVGLAFSPPRRARKAEACLEGHRPNEASIAAAAQRVWDDLPPEYDTHREYEKEIMKILTARALGQALHPSKFNEG